MEENEEEAKKLVECKICGNKFKKEDLMKSCSNCFACTGCEAYICPVCDNEIVVVPIKRKF